MKEISLNHSSLFSKRVFDHLNNPRHCEGGNENEIWTWNVNMEETEGDLISDKVLTLSYSNPSLNSFESVFLECLARILNGKKLNSLLGLSFREIENYLRDENHLSAFMQTDGVELENCFRKVKNSLLGSVILNKIGKNQSSAYQLASWPQLSLVEKNRKINALLKEISREFLFEKGLRLVLVENDTVYLQGNDFFLDLQVVEIVLAGLISQGDLKSSLKVVAAL